MAVVFLCSILDVTKDRTIETPTQNGGSGGASAGGIIEDSTLGSLQKESIDTTVSITYAWAGTQAEVDSVVAAGDIDTNDFGAHFQITITNNFEYDDRVLESGEIRSFVVTQDYTVSVSYAWVGSSETVETDADGGVTTKTTNYNASGALLFQGDHRHEGRVSVDADGNFIESYSQIGSGDNDIYLTSDNVVSSSYSEGDLINSGYGTEIDVTIADDYLFESDGGFNYTGDGVRNATTDDGDTEYHLLATNHYELFSSPEITTSYDTVQDRTIEFNEDIVNSHNDGSSDDSGDGSGDDQADPITMQSVVYAVSGSSDASPYLHAYGDVGTSFDSITLYGGVEHTTLDSDSLDYWDTTGSNMGASSQYQLLATSEGYYYSETGSSSLNIESDTIGDNHTLTFLQMDTVEGQAEDPDLVGFIDSDTRTLQDRTKIESDSAFNHRLVMASTIGTEETPGELTTNTLAIDYLNNYVSEGIDQTGAANNPAKPQAVDGMNFFYSVTQGEFSSTYEEILTDGDDNVKLEFLAGDSTQLKLDGDNQYTYTTSGDSKLSFDSQLTSGNIETENGMYWRDHFSVENTNASDGGFGEGYDLQWLFDEGAFTESESDETDGSGEGETSIVVDGSKITLTGSSAANASSTTDSDVTTSRSRSESGGRYAEGEFDSNDQPLDNNSEYRLEKWFETSEFIEIENLMGGASSQSASTFTPATQAFDSDSSSNYSSDVNGDGSTFSSYSLDQVGLNGEFEVGGGDGSNGGEAESIPFERHELHYSYQSDSTLDSTGGGSADFARDLTSKIVDHSIEEEDQNNGGGNTSGDGGTGPAGGGTDGQQDPPPTYTFDLDENKTLSNSGVTTLNNSSSYGIDVNSPSFTMDYSETYTGMSGMDDGVVATHQESHISSVNNASRTNTSFSDETDSNYEWREDGLYLVTNGYTETTLVSSGETKNHGPIVNQKDHDYGDGNTKVVNTTIDTNDYHVTYNDTTKIRDDYDDFGQQVVFSTTDVTDDNGQLVDNEIQVDGNGVGKHIRTINSLGNESFTYKPTTVETVTTPFGGGSRTDNISLVKTGGWNLTDTVEGDFEANGAYTITFTPSGERNSTTNLDTDGEHAYSFTDDVTDDEGYLLETEQEGWYESSTLVNSTLVRSGSIEAGYDADGTLTSATGSVINTANSDGSATATEDDIVNKSKSRTIVVSDGSGSGSGGGQAGGTNGGSNGPEVLTTDDVYTAGRRLIVSSSENFDSEQIDQFDAGIGTDGDLTVAHNEDASSFTNNVWGSRSGSDTSFVQHDETDHYSDGTSVTDTVYIQVPQSQAMDGQYGNADSNAADAKNVAYVGFFEGDDSDDAFNSAGYIGRVIDTSYDQGANLTFSTASGGHGVEEQAGFSSLQQEEDDEEQSNDNGDNQAEYDDTEILHAGMILQQFDELAIYLRMKRLVPTTPPSTLLKHTNPAEFDLKMKEYELELEAIANLERRLNHFLANDESKLREIASHPLSGSIAVVIEGSDSPSQVVQSRLKVEALPEPSLHDIGRYQYYWDEAIAGMSEQEQRLYDFLVNEHQIITGTGPYEGKVDNPQAESGLESRIQAIERRIFYDVRLLRFNDMTPAERLFRLDSQLNIFAWQLMLTDLAGLRVETPTPTGSQGGTSQGSRRAGFNFGFGANADGVPIYSNGNAPLTQKPTLLRQQSVISHIKERRVGGKLRRLIFDKNTGSIILIRKTKDKVSKDEYINSLIKYAKRKKIKILFHILEGTHITPQLDKTIEGSKYLELLRVTNDFFRD